MVYSMVVLIIYLQTFFNLRYLHSLKARAFFRIVTDLFVFCFSKYVAMAQKHQPLHRAKSANPLAKLNESHS